MNYPEARDFLVSEGEDAHTLPLLAQFKVSSKKVLFDTFTDKAWDAWFRILKRVTNDLLEAYPSEVLLVHNTARSTISVLINPSQRGSEAFEFFRQELEAFLTLRSHGFEFLGKTPYFLKSTAEAYQFPTPLKLFGYFRLKEHTRRGNKDLRRTRGLYVFSSRVKTCYNPDPSETWGTYYLTLGMIVKCYEAIVTPQPTGESRSTHDLEEIEPVPV